MWKFILPLIVLVNSAQSSDPGDARQNEVNGDQGFAYSFSGSNPSAVPFAIPYFPVFNFNPLFSDFGDIKRFNEELAAKAASSKGILSYSYSASIGDGRANSSAFSISRFPKENIGHAASFGHPGNIPNFASRFADVSDGLGGSASATGSVGNGQARQTASINPQNPNVPNINTQYGADTGNGGSYGVFTSSFSETLPNGKTRQRASTTVNDNGKVRSYSVHNP